MSTSLRHPTLPPPTAKGDPLRPLDVVGILAVLPAVLGSLCLITRIDLSFIPLAAAAVLFLSCIVSALLGLLISWGMTSPRLVRFVRLGALVWLGLCGWTAVRFALHLAGGLPG